MACGQPPAPPVAPVAPVTRVRLARPICVLPTVTTPLSEIETGNRTGRDVRSPRTMTTAVSTERPRAGCPPMSALMLQGLMRTRAPTGRLGMVELRTTKMQEPNSTEPAAVPPPLATGEGWRAARRGDRQRGRAHGTESRHTAIEGEGLAADGLQDLRTVGCVHGDDQVAGHRGDVRSAPSSSTSTTACGEHAGDKKNDRQGPDSILLHLRLRGYCGTQPRRFEEQTEHLSGNQGDGRVTGGSAEHLALQTRSRR